MENSSMENDKLRRQISSLLRFILNKYCLSSNVSQLASSVPPFNPEKVPEVKTQVKPMMIVRRHMQTIFWRTSQNKAIQRCIVNIMLLITQRFWEAMNKKIRNLQKSLKSSKQKEDIGSSSTQQKRTKKIHMIYTPEDIIIVNSPNSQQYLSVTFQKAHYNPKLRKYSIDYIRPSSRNKERFDESDLIYCIGVIFDQCLHGERYNGFKKYQYRSFVPDKVGSILCDIFNQKSKIETLVELERRITLVYSEMERQKYGSDQNSMKQIVQLIRNQLESLSMVSESIIDSSRSQRSMNFNGQQISNIENEERDSQQQLEETYDLNY